MCLQLLAQIVEDFLESIGNFLESIFVGVQQRLQAVHHLQNLVDAVAIKIDGPHQEDFLKIFAMVARKRKMPLDEDTLVHLLNVRYPEIDNVYANYQPIFLIDQMISICEFEGIPYQMTPDLIDRAWANMFVKDEVIVK